MTGRLNKLQQDLKNIETEVANLAERMREKYRIYLDSFGESLYKQAIGAVYHICTRYYGGEFLALSHSNRQKLQEEIKTLGQEAKASLQQLGEQSFDREAFSGVGLPKSPAEMKNTPDFLKLFLDKRENLASTGEINNPDILLYCCRVLEKNCIEILNHLSRQINQQLQKAYILPPNLPSQIIDRAIQAGEEGQSLGGGNNMLNILVEAKNPEPEEEKDEDDGDDNDFSSGKVTKVTAIHLRMAELEFADARLSVERNQIRSLWEQLNRLGEQYHRVRKEYTIAQAEAAWRSSWYD
ncbi:MAG: hypothetical protein EWV55_10290 [Microcystis viridis Mv_BB_P_19951000_S69]|jgi:hypothetical protein|uniref:Uncharacterized protein n=1 Tax=Microcystis viridis Mv_BB_P_19951000_S68D TaxID=2486270 RepID=A0A552H6T5_MICVR|nr:hypothetical protein [Microcystis aeruginosa LG13-11]TRU66948.1 MAG: hypothetical protein EWV77_23645 [Microcystis viridis Mv_BB_P_19951000_S68D]TRU72926.1 MAG: hypothetical protein EWV47_14185 [Microcystis viridis Mv_BB_P_19951000_S68]TRU74763.1 MAG: hypothetical protein EWV55_10290 [Microcystis viridis Mv_BB_P_19951000_S69]TRU82428.1 MAG: hypothetical protein EWV46_18760 [Microcystis viridis Mv_BB_P_19951000_S69D]